MIGGSAGALDPLKQIILDLPVDLPAAVIVVLHLATTSKSALAPILNRLGGMHVVAPKDGDPIRPGYVYVAVPDHHLEVTSETFRLTRGPKVNGSRPAIDVLFKSAAAAFGERVVGVVLSGGLDDGTAGVIAIHAAGGVGIAQSRDDALIESMPKNVIQLANPKHVLRADEIGAMIKKIVGGSTVKEAVPSSNGEEFEMEAVGAHDAPGRLTGLTCPDCHGSIWLEPLGSRFVFRASLRRALIFGRHDLMQDAPISRLSLLICRNTLMYFTSEAQGRILARFHYALNDDGYLFLGRAEMLLTHSELFAPVDMKQRIFSKVARIQLRERLMLLAQSGNAGSARS